MPLKYIELGIGTKSFISIICLPEWSESPGIKDFRDFGIGYLLGHYLGPLGLREHCKASANRLETVTWNLSKFQTIHT